MVEFLIRSLDVSSRKPAVKNRLHWDWSLRSNDRVSQYFTVFFHCREQRVGQHRKRSSKHARSRKKDCQIEKYPNFHSDLLR